MPKYLLAAGQKKGRTGPVFYRLLASFLLMLIIPIIVLLMNYSHARRLLQEENQHYQDATLAQVQMRIDEKLNSLTAAALETATDETVVSVLSSEDLDGSILATRMAALVRTIDRHAIAYGALSNFYLYSFHYDRLIYRHGIYTDISTKGAAILESEELNAQLLKGLQGDRYFCQYAVLRGSNGQSQLVLYHTLPLWSTNLPAAGTLCLCVDASNLFDDIDAMQELNSGLVCLLDAAGEPVICTGDMDLTASIPQTLAGDKFLRIGSREYTISVRPCAVGGWQYLSIQPQDQLLLRLRQTRNLSLFLFAAASLLGLCLTLILTNHNYQPVRQLIETLRKQKIILNEQLNTGENEYALIERSAVDIASSISVIRTALQEEIPRIQQAVLAQLLHGGVTDYTEFRHTLEETGVLMPYRNYCLAVLTLHDTDTLPSEESAVFAIILREQLMQALPHTIVFAVASMRQDGAAVIFNSDLEDFESRLGGILRDAQNTMRKDFGWMVPICVSEVLTELEQIPRAYYITKRALYTSRFGTGLVMLSQVHYSLRLEQTLDGARSQLQNHIASGNKNALLHMLKDLHKQNFADGAAADPYSVQAYYISLLSILTGAYPPAGPLPLAQGAESPLEQLFHAQSPEIMLDIVCEAAGVLCDGVQSSQRDHAVRLTGRILDFLEKEYANSELSLSYVAEHFYVTSSYLSTFFKKNVGDTFLNYLTSLRMERAKTLLRTTNRPIAEVAAMVGYASGNTFTRIFKKFEGVTPTQFRENS